MSGVSATEKQIPDVSAFLLIVTMLLALLDERNKRESDHAKNCEN